MKTKGLPLIRVLADDHWECPFEACPDYDIIGSEHSCRSSGRCVPGRTGGEGALMIWGTDTKPADIFGD